MGKRKFRLRERVFVSARAAGNSWFVGHYGQVVDYDRDKKMYGVVFRLPGNGHEEYRKFSAYKLDSAQSCSLHIDMKKLFNLEF